MLWTLLAIGIGLQTGSPEGSSATALEQALAAQRCGGSRAAAAQETAQHEECLRAQLEALRADFGRNLSRLTAADRRTIDADCRKIDAALERDAYVKCLSDQLAALHSHRRAAAPTAAATPAEPSATVPPAAAALSLHPQSSEQSMMVWGGAALAGLVVVGGGLFVALKGRRARHKCRVCGNEDVPGAGAMCQKCRREAADALRSVAAERVDQERAQEDEQRRQREREEEQVRLRASREEDARVRQQEQARQEEQAREEETSRRREEEAHDRRQVGAPADDDASNPHAVLGVPRDASPEAIRAAYEDGKKKYDRDLVADMSVELQEHFKTKADAVERAYQALANP